MPSIPPSIAAETAITRQNVALSAIKQSAEQSEKLAEILQESERSAPVNTTRGSNLNVLV